MRQELSIIIVKYRIPGTSLKRKSGLAAWASCRGEKGRKDKGINARARCLSHTDLVGRRIK